MRTTQLGTIIDESLLIVGNGFDLFLDAKTSYECFFEYLYKCFKAASLESFTEKLSDEDNKQVASEFYGLLHDNSDNYFINYFINLKRIFGSWVSFENELLKIITSFDELVYYLNSPDGIFIDTRSNYPRLILKALDKFSLLSVLNVYQDNKFVSTNTSNFAIVSTDGKGVPFFIKNGEDKTIHTIRNKIERFSNAISTELYKDLLCFSHLFVLYLGIIEKSVNLKKSFNINDDCILYINYNYTSFLEDFLKANGKEFSRMLYINGSIKRGDQKLDDRIVFGIDSNTVLKNKGFEVFTKGIQRSLMDTDISKLYSLCCENIKRIYIFGHSLSLADYESLNYVLVKTKRHLELIVVYYYDMEARIELTANLKTILSDELFYSYQRAGTIRFIKSNKVLE